ncbi:hypothetical protein AAHH72_19265 [Bacillus cereus]
MINKVEVFLEYPEEMIGVARIETIVCYDQDNREIKDEIPDLINDEFYPEEDDLKSIEERVQSYVAKQLKVSADIVQIEE